MATLKKIKERYFRKVIACPNGLITHHGDCSYYDIHICTCGFLHDLMTSKSDKIRSEFSKQLDRHNYALDKLKAFLRYTVEEKKKR